MQSLTSTIESILPENEISRKPQNDTEFTQYGVKAWKALPAAQNRKMVQPIANV